MSIHLSSSVMKVTDLMDQRKVIEEKIEDAAKVAMWETMKKIYAAFESSGFDMERIEAEVWREGECLVFFMPRENRDLLKLGLNDNKSNDKGQHVYESTIVNWCRKHYSPVNPHNFYRRNKFFFKIKDWEDILLDETRSSDIPVEGECPELNGEFDYTGEWDTFALDGKRYRIEVGQQVVLNGSWRQWAGGQFVN